MFVVCVASARGVLGLSFGSAQLARVERNRLIVAGSLLLLNKEVDVTLDTDVGAVHN